MPTISSSPVESRIPLGRRTFHGHSRRRRELRVGATSTEIRDLVVDACLTWDERFVLDASHYDERRRRARFAERVPVAYKQDFDAVRAAEDMAVFEGLAPGK
ncbi:hypothetical protein ACETU7_17130 [Rhodococcus sp. 3Y1]